MKKLCIIVAISALTFLAACGNNEDKEINADKEKETTQTSSMSDSDNNDQQKAATTEDSNKSQSGKSPENQDSDKTDSNSEVVQFKEYAYIKEKVSNIEDFKAITETNNPNKRVILYQSDEGQKKYKSIFIKKTNRLKLIELDKNGMLYNQVIK